MSNTNPSIKFITKRTDHHETIYKSQKIATGSTFDEMEIYLQKVVITGLDLEFNGERLFYSTPLLASIGETGNLWVVDLTSVLPEFVEVLRKYLHKVRMVGHNLQADMTILKAYCIRFFKFDLEFPLIWDTMLGEQRLNLGMTGISNSLAATYKRRLGVFMDEEKDIRMEFIPMTVSSKFMYKHISYSGGDTGRIVEIAMVQRQLLHERGQFEFVKNIECELVEILTDMKLDGCALSVDKWNTMILNKQRNMLKVENAMDKAVATLTKTTYKERRRGEYVSLDLFGQHKEVENLNKKKLNYGSPKQIFNKVFIPLKQPIPQLVSKGKSSNSTKEDALQQYIIERPHTILREFIDNLIEYRGYKKLITSYGKKFLYPEIRKKGKTEIGFVNPYTGKVHTLYKQCFTETGRLSSGGSKEGFFNSQNLPADNEIKECFTLTPEEIADGWVITTCDLSQAELIIMAALANDQHLYEIGADKVIDGVKVEGDLHSVFAQKGWRAIYAHRKKLGRSMTIQDTKNKKYELIEGFPVSKKENKQLRTDYKRMGFGTVYGMKGNKAGQTLNIPTDEGEIAIKTIKDEIPLTFAMVEAAAYCAVADGYVIFNKRSNNRRWFNEVLAIHAILPSTLTRHERYLKTKELLPFKVLSEIEGAARNCRIQGTQADMLKEAMVMIKRYIKAHNIQARFIFTVHDELVIKHKDKAFGAVIANMMKSAADAYLSLYSDNIRMNASFVTLTNWIKE